MQIHYVNLIEYIIVQICIQSDEILLEIYDALIDLLLCSFKSTFGLKVANFRVVKFSMQVFNVILSVKFLIMIMYAHHMISSLIARLLWQVWCKSLQLLFFHDEINWYLDHDVFTVSQLKHQEIRICDALLLKLARSINALACITLIVIIIMLTLMIRCWSSFSLEFQYTKSQDKQHILCFQIL